MATSASLIISFIIFSTVIVLYVINKNLADLQFLHNVPQEYNWLVHGFKNVLGYATVFLPGYLVYKYVQKINYIKSCGNSWLAVTIKSCFKEDELVSTSNIGNTPVISQKTAWPESIILLFHFIGLQVSYLSWGVIQEKVMTRQYQNSNDEVEYFKDSQFLVFINRILAFLMSGIYILCQEQHRHRCPLYKYVFCSFSNIMSSWCQYEALKYVSFPHQVLAKAAKTIPVMIMGKIVSKNKYEYYEYVTAVILSIGMLLFMLDAGNDRASSTVTTFSGAILLCSYIVFDSFTSNWQGALFKSYFVKPIQMMCFVNLYSCIFTACSLLQQGALMKSIDFMFKYPSFIMDCMLLSICSATGQLFIFSTISKFGPLVFAIITTIRQGFSVLLSCIIYNHVVHSVGILGVILVFISVLLRIYCGYRIKKRKKQHPVNQQKIIV